MARAANSDAWAVGRLEREGFLIRRVLWGRVLAREEKRPGEEIRRAMILVDDGRRR